MSARVVASLSLGGLTWLGAIEDAHAVHPAYSVVRGPDFDADGFADLAFGAHDSPSPAFDAGQVFLLWGGPFGLDIDEDRGAVLWQDAPGIADASSANDRFGRTLAWGDFDGDCHDDLVVGVPGETIDIYAQAGAVHVFYGSDAGLSPDDDVVMHRDGPGMEGMLEAGARFGHALAVGDFDGDFFDDIAIASRSTVDGAVFAGDVHIVYGSPSGLDPTAGPGDEVLDAGSTGLHVPEAYTDFGSQLAAGDFDCDGDDDIAIRGGLYSDAQVHVLQGSSGGVQNRGGQLWSSRSRHLAGIDWFTVTALVAGNFDGNTAVDPDGDYISRACMDLAIGLPNVEENTGAVVVLYGQPYDSATPGLTLDTSTPWYFDQNTGDIPAPHGPYDDDSFGTWVALAQLDTGGLDQRQDLLVGVSNGVIALRGTTAGLTDEHSVRWTRDTPGIPGIPSVASIWFGERIGFGDYDADGSNDVAITAPHYNGFIFPGFGNDVTVLDLEAAAPPVIDGIESWMAVDFPDQVAGTDEYLGVSATEGRSVLSFCL